MSGQQAGLADPSNPAQATNVDSDQSVSADSYKASASNVTSDASAFEQMGQSLNSFFGATSKAVADVSNTINQQSVIQIQRQNEALAKQGQADSLDGKVIDPAYASRQAYAGAYQQASADTHAAELTRGLQSYIFTNMPRDGTGDPAAMATQYFKDNVQTTGDPTYDARLLYSYSQNANAITGQQQENVLRQGEATATQGIMDDGIRQIRSQNGIQSTGQFADLTARVMTVTHGDLGKADALIGSIMGNVENQTQALANDRVLTESGWANRNPEQYLKIKEQLLKNTNSIKDEETQQMVDVWQQDMHAVHMNPNATMADYTALMQRAQDIDTVHGTGQAPFADIYRAMGTMSKKVAQSNLFVSAFNGDFGGSNDGLGYAQRFGVEPQKALKEGMDKGGLPTIVQQAGNAGQLPALNASIAGTGYVNPFYNPDGKGAAMQEFGQLFGSAKMRQAMPFGFSDGVAAQFHQQFNDSNPANQALAFQGIKAIIDSPNVGADKLAAYLPDQQDRNTFNYLNKQVQSGGDINTLLANAKANPQQTDKLVKASEDGNYDWASLTGQPATQRASLDAQFEKEFQSAVVTNLGRGGIFSNPTVSMDPVLKNDIRMQVAQNLQQQQQLNPAAAPSIKDAMATVFTGAQGHYSVTPGVNGNLNVALNPFGSAGQGREDPINASPQAQYSVTKDYPPMYSGTPMNDFLDQPVDPVAQAATRLQTAQARVQELQGVTLWNRPDPEGRDDAGHARHVAASGPVRSGATPDGEQRGRRQQRPAVLATCRRRRSACAARPRRPAERDPEVRHDRQQPARSGGQLPDRPEAGELVHPVDVRQGLPCCPGRRCGPPDRSESVDSQAGLHPRQRPEDGPGRAGRPPSAEPSGPRVPCGPQCGSHERQVVGPASG